MSLPLDWAVVGTSLGCVLALSGHRVALLYCAFSPLVQQVVSIVRCLFQYLASTSLACPADPSTWGYGGETERLVAENDGVDPDSVRPFCISYVYDPMWQFDEATHLIPTVIWTRYPDGGLFGCSFHGTPMERDPGTYTGLVLRVRADGSIVRAQVDHPPGAHMPGLVLYGNDFHNDLCDPEFDQGHRRPGAGAMDSRS